MSQSIEPVHEHDSTWLLIPWYVNGRIGEQQRIEVDAHLRTCQACQDELLAQRKLCQAMADSSPEVEQLPTASLRRLMQTIDAQGPATREIPLRAEKSTTAQRHQTAPRWSRSLAASLALIAVATGSFVGLKHMKTNRVEPAANYYTVTSPSPRVASEVVRAVFSPAITVTEMQTILNEAQLSIVAGPTPAGVYSLAKTGVQTVDESLARLRSHQQVLFAEPSTLTDVVRAQ